MKYPDYDTYGPSQKNCELCGKQGYRYISPVRIPGMSKEEKPLHAIPIEKMNKDDILTLCEFHTNEWKKENKGEA